MTDLTNRIAKPPADWHNPRARDLGGPVKINARPDGNKPTATAKPVHHPNMTDQQAMNAGKGGIGDSIKGMPGANPLEKPGSYKGHLGQTVEPVIGHRSRISGMRDKLVAQAESQRVFDSAVQSGGADFHDRLFSHHFESPPLPAYAKEKSEGDQRPSSGPAEKQEIKNAGA